VIWFFSGSIPEAPPHLEVGALAQYPIGLFPCVFLLECLITCMPSLSVFPLIEDGLGPFDLLLIDGTSDNNTLQEKAPKINRLEPFIGS
jgi:hypothetical protein